MTERAILISKDVDCTFCDAKAGENCWSQEALPNGEYPRLTDRGHTSRVAPAPPCPRCGIGEGEVCVDERGEPLPLPFPPGGHLIPIRPIHRERTGQ